MPDIVIRCKCGKLLTEMKRETESMYGDRLVISVEPCTDCKVEELRRWIRSTQGRSWN